MRRLCKPSSVGRVQIGRDVTDGQAVINRGLLSSGKLLMRRHFHY
jgi:hypothetical protein